MTIPIIRKRAKRPKTHTGCITCRARHIKCDEAKPSCVRCQKSNRRCEGYTEPRRPTRGQPVHVLPKPGCGSSAKATPPSPPPAAASTTSTALSTMADDDDNDSDIHTTPSSRPHPLNFPFTLPPSPPSLTCELTALELSAFDFFRAETAHRLPGNSWALSWPRLALHVGPHEPAVMHIAIALGSLYRAQRGMVGGGTPGGCCGGGSRSGSSSGSPSYDADDDDGGGADPIARAKAVEQHRGFALRQYGRALAELRSYIGSLEAGDAKVEVVLLVVLLFFCFEVWGGDDVRAGLHLRTGLRILHDWHRRRGRVEECYGRDQVRLDVRPRGDMGVLVQSFVKLDADLSIVNKGEPFLYPVVREPVPESFGSLGEAMVYLDALSSAIQMVYDVMADVARVGMRADLGVDHAAMTGDCLAAARARTVPLDAGLEGKMDEIRRGVRQFMGALVFVPVGPEQEAVHVLLQFHLFFSWYDTLAWREPGEMHTDKLQKQFEHALGLAERYIGLHQETAQGDPPTASSRSNGPFSSLPKTNWRPVISLGTGLVAGICLIALKCRDSAVRRRCIQLLRDVNLRGVFDSAYISSFMQTIINLEENRARAILGRQDGSDLRCHEVPDEARILDIDLGERSTSLGEAFYKADFGLLVYAIRDAEGEVQVHSVCFLVERNL